MTPPSTGLVDVLGAALRGRIRLDVTRLIVVLVAAAFASLFLPQPAWAGGEPVWVSAFVVLTAISIVLGVAMISGTYVLTDTIKAAFGTVFTQVYEHTDAVITGKSAIGGGGNNNVVLPSLPQSLLARVRSLPGVEVAEGGINDEAKLVGPDNKVVSQGGAPNLAFSVNPRGDQRFNPLVLTAGRWPNGPHEIAIDTKTASNKHFKVGDSIGVLARFQVSVPASSW